MSHSSTIPSFTVKELFESADQYIIPVYQRNYAWGYGELKQLIDDIHDYSTHEEKKHTPYYIGTLVVFERHEAEHFYFETIDGQQRLTTLTLLINAIKRWCFHELQEDFVVQMKLKFFSRPKSEAALSVVQRELDKPAYFVNSIDYETSVEHRYKDAEKVLKDLFKEPQNALSFYDYLKHQVHLIRVPVPKETDLNHYFEIMNNRGEQLEKHEVLKSKLMSLLKDDEIAKYAFQKAWNAVEDMDRYVQYGFKPKERNGLFGAENWNTLQINNFEEYKNTLNATIKRDDKGIGIRSIINHQDNFIHKNRGQNNNQKKEEAPERFNSVINFQGFLLHVLRIFKQADVPLDDKRLISEFEKYIRTKEEAEAFVFALLKCKHLFDQYVIKREFLADKDQWSLKHIKWYKDEKIGYENTFGDTYEQSNVKMLLAMFHVSLPSMNYKHWLSASLNYLYGQMEKVDSVAYGKYLFGIAKSYFYDRILAPDNPLDYFNMIFKRNEWNTRILKEEELHWDQLHRGTGVENFAFNFTDYLIWKKEGSAYYDMSPRSSVEHYYPQNPIDGVRLSDQNLLNSFGNLCLVSSSTNSRLSNFDPLAKKNHYASVKNESLKLKQMMERTSENQPWDSQAIAEYEEELINLLKKKYH